MADVYKKLGESFPAAATLTAIYTVPGATATVGSSVVVCNQSANPDFFRISHAVAGAADTASQYLYFDLPIGANDTFIATIGWNMQATDVLRVRSTNGACSFNAYGVERS